MSGCQLNISLHQLLVPLAATPITTLSAANCGLTGEMPNLHSLTATVDGRGLAGWESPLGTALQALDVSSNRLERVNCLPVKMRLDVSRNARPLYVGGNVIKKAVESGIDFWLVGSELANRPEVMEFCSDELKTDNLWIPRHGYSCHDLLSPQLRVTPELFLPLEMCACGSGFLGTAINCTPCPKDTFNAEMNRSKCDQCPSSSNSPEGSTSLRDCVCHFGSAMQRDGAAVCQCDRNEAWSIKGECLQCSDLHLLCTAPGSIIATAPMQEGYTRFQKEPERIFKCLAPEHCTNSTCAPGQAPLSCALPNQTDIVTARSWKQRQ